MTVKHSERVFRLELNVALSLCENIGTPRALCVYLLAKAGQWRDILDLSVNPDHYDDHQSFSDDYLVTSILQKCPRLPTGIDTEAVAKQKFLDAEAVCAETNERLSLYDEGRFSPFLDVEKCLHRVRFHIKRILGPLTRAKLHFMEESMRFGPGATTSLSGVVSQGKKYSHRPLDATPRVLPFRAFGFPVGWRSFSGEISLRRASKVRIVPKNAKTGRTICIEPDLNIFVQLGTGALIREQLRKAGLDLLVQAEENRRLASLAWVSDLCTMDLSAASDTISREAVWNLLPYEWCDLLHFSRVDYTEMDGKEIALSKWSSMGNGYTFELETLIFYSILLGAADCSGLAYDNIATFGDDLIFPNSMRLLVERTLNFLGFKVNNEKTFGKGSFHESCGTDWFKGRNVRPFFLRSEHHDFPTVCYIIANSITHWASRRNGGWSRDARCLPAWIRCFTACESKARFRIPSGFGDVGFVSEWDEAHPARAGRGWGGWKFPVRNVPAMMSRISEQGCLTAFLNGNASQWSLARESLRGRYRTAVTSWGHSLEWPALGPWL